MLSPPLLAAAPRRLLAAAAIGSALLTGCYNPDTLIQRVRDRAIRTRLEELDLGKFRVTLPRDPVTSGTTEVDLHVYGELPRYKVAKTRNEFEDKAYLLHDKTLTVLREIDPKHLSDPELKVIRARLLATVNGVLDEPTIDSVGFYDLRFIRH